MQGQVKSTKKTVVQQEVWMFQICLQEAILSDFIMQVADLVFRK